MEDMPGFRLVECIYWDEMNIRDRSKRYVSGDMAERDECPLSRRRGGQGKRRAEIIPQNSSILYIHIREYLIIYHIWQYKREVGWGLIYEHGGNIKYSHP